MVQHRKGMRTFLKEMLTQRVFRSSVATNRKNLPANLLDLVLGEVRAWANTPSVQPIVVPFRMREGTGRHLVASGSSSLPRPHHPRTGASPVHRVTVPRPVASGVGYPTLLQAGCQVPFLKYPCPATKTVRILQDILAKVIPRYSPRRASTRQGT